VIPSSSRTLAINLTLGSIYLKTGTRGGSSSFVIDTFRQALRQDPFALEAIDALVEVCKHMFNVVIIKGNVDLLCLLFILAATQAAEAAFDIINV